VNARGATILIGAAFGIVACAETRRSLGGSCLKDDDCLSGICADQECTSAPPLLDAEPPATVAADAEPGPEASIDAAPPPEAGDSSAGEGGG
jgi:hypothetical protein